MRKLRMLALPVVIVMIAAACSAKESGDGNGGGGNQEENKGTVNVLNALEPAEIGRASCRERVYSNV